MLQFQEFREMNFLTIAVFSLTFSDSVTFSHPIHGILSIFQFHGKKSARRMDIPERFYLRVTKRQCLNKDNHL
jgi:hypothetical protein